jgi:hypothetical protein
VVAAGIFEVASVNGSKEGSVRTAAGMSFAKFC